MTKTTEFTETEWEEMTTDTTETLNLSPKSFDELAEAVEQAAANFKKAVAVAKEAVLAAIEEKKRNEITPENAGEKLDELIAKLQAEGRLLTAENDPEGFLEMARLHERDALQIRDQVANAHGSTWCSQAEIDEVVRSVETEAGRQEKLEAAQRRASRNS